MRQFFVGAHCMRPVGNAGAERRTQCAPTGRPRMLVSRSYLPENVGRRRNEARPVGCVVRATLVGAGWRMRRRMLPLKYGPAMKSAPQSAHARLAKKAAQLVTTGKVYAPASKQQQTPASRRARLRDHRAAGPGGRRTIGDKKLTYNDDTSPVGRSRLAARRVSATSA